ncbi:LuxR family transcriptional regulator [Streptomyces bambusae]|uniref:AAA family ATPase n=1 Tax=Streptomyces bambusae TaxID=1550616 RepID=UPI001CFD64F0|nr:LuxR family transcriptional regulator [Streptomyces bambusae]MCB5168259.1 LuxR family transcriptional regulator [Streptomyces bambusae]
MPTHSITVESGGGGRRGTPPTAVPERAAHLEVLLDLFRDALGGASRVGVLSGPVGSGKTELLSALSGHAAEAGARVLTATASRLEQAVPFALLAQLFHASGMAPTFTGPIAAWVAEAQAATATGARPGDDGGDVAPAAFHGMCMALLDLVGHLDGPLLIGVDDAQFADLASLRCLSFVVRRLRSAPLLVLLNESLHTRWPATLSQAELPAQPVSRHLRLPLLSPLGVESMMTEQLGPRVASALAAEAYDVSGGNPLLVRGLIEDNRYTVPPRTPVFRVGAAFSKALIGCVYRYEPEVRHVARRLALLDEAPPLHVLAKLAGLDADNTAQTVNLLRETGLLSNGLLRHPQAAAALLGGMTTGERFALHTHTANELFKNGSSALTVARHLLAADRLDSQCAIPVLHEAAEQALVDGESQFALDCLRLAHEHDDDDRRRAAGVAMLVRAAWRSSPYAAYRRVPSLTESGMAGMLSGPRVSAAVDAHLWFGHPDEAHALIERGAREPAADDALAASHLAASRLWLHALYPAWNSDAGSTDAADPWALGVSPELGAKRRAAAMLSANTTTGPDTALVAEAQEILRNHPLADDTLPALTVALHTLVHAERTAEAGEWAERLVGEARRHSAPLWEALFRSVRAEVLLRRGRPHAAEQEVTEALGLLPARNWGIFLALPLATVLQANALTGNESPVVEEAQAALPAAAFGTPLGMRVLRARGLKALANGQAAAALDDFLAMGGIAARCGTDSPAVAPWRTGAAMACVRLGDPDRARSLVEEELRMAGAWSGRETAAALRVLAACSSGGDMLRLLGRAAEQLEACDAPVELAFVLHDLGWALQEHGQYSKGRLMLRRARLMAEEAGVRLTARSGAPAGQGTDDAAAADEPAAGGTEGRLRSLSDAELRVMHLAVESHSNRQIASQLFVTVSTVEQHLTRIYRKLGVKRRTDLVEVVHGAGLRAEALRTPTAC